jgi:hypothetical protein
VSKGKIAVLAVALAAAAAAGALVLGILDAGGVTRGARPASPDYPGGHPIDASFITTGRVALERMPAEVTGALEVHSAEIARNATELEKTVAILETKQARISGTCAPGSAIRLVGPDGSVVCQRLPQGVLSVAALSAVPRSSTTGTAQGSVPGGVGRYQTAGEDDWLVAPVPLPDGAVVTGFSYVFWDADAAVDGAAYLYRSDDTPLAAVKTRGAASEVRIVDTEQIDQKKVDATAYGYFVYFQLSAKAGAALMPIAASVSYRLP